MFPFLIKQMLMFIDMNLFCWQASLLSSALRFKHPKYNWSRVILPFGQATISPYIVFFQQQLVIGFTRFHQVSPGFTRFHQVSPGFTGFHHGSLLRNEVKQPPPGATHVAIFVYVPDEASVGGMWWAFDNSKQRRDLAWKRLVLEEISQDLVFDAQASRKENHPWMGFYQQNRPKLWIWRMNNGSVCPKWR